MPRVTVGNLKFNDSVSSTMIIYLYSHICQMILRSTYTAGIWICDFLINFVIFWIKMNRDKCVWKKLI